MTLKISKIETFHLKWAHGQSPLVRIWAGDLYGLGSPSPMMGGNASLELISQMSAFLAGKDALDTAVIQDRLFHEFIKTGPDGALAAAIAAVDIALWDLKGKFLGQPIYKLLGGAWKTKLACYASIGGMAARKTDEACREVETWMKHKPGLVKIRFDGDKTERDPDVERDIEKARAVRELLGPKFPLAFDANNRYSAQAAVRVGRVLEELGFEWFEEPCPHYHYDAYEKVSRSLDIAVAAGEQEYTLQGIQRLIDAGVDIVQPDIIKTGGFTGLQRMSVLAMAHGVDFLPHQTQRMIGQAATAHFVASLLHSHYPVECADFTSDSEIFFRDPLKPEDGFFNLDDKPGLGCELIEERLKDRIVAWRK